MSATPTKSLPNDPDETELRQREIGTAAAVLSLSGPCRGVGDLYLTCVATAGLGMCRSFRSDFEQCSKSTAESSTEMLGSIGEQMYGRMHNKEDRLLEAARMINLHNLSNLQSIRPAQQK
mmetsp:Transcript_106818/g.159732  ORF Transcript_106818/g.159732 Transcript_106818/m.159732 type:complete len:120 (+) Transcript_106818:114-473(+)